MVFELLSADEWVYPDSRASKKGKGDLELDTARNTRISFQILFNELKEGSSLDWNFESKEGRLNNPLIYELIPVKVHQNTGPIGFTAEENDEIESYITRKAPFDVFDAMKPVKSGIIVDKDIKALYISWEISADMLPGKYKGRLHLINADQQVELAITINVYSATIPEKETLAITNWYDIECMAGSHGLEAWSEEHWEMILKYGKMMRRSRQNYFLVPMSLLGITEKDDSKFEFDFTKIKRLIEIYLEIGFSCIEAGHIVSRKDFHDPDFVIKTRPDIKAVSHKGYEFLKQYVKKWNAFLEENNWKSITVQHIGDEPYKNSFQEYGYITGVVRRFLPGVPIIEAMEEIRLGAIIDILVPKNKYYEECRDEFESLREAGIDIWHYTCCFPGGNYLNRLLDAALIRTRLLHWGNYIYNLSGYLHWGLNEYRESENVFEFSRRDKTDENKLILPPGDTHVVYPGDDCPWGSVRLEAMASGACDYELLRIIETADREAADEIAGLCIRNFSDFTEDTEHLKNTYRKLLMKIDGKS